MIKVWLKSSLRKVVALAESIISKPFRMALLQGLPFWVASLIVGLVAVAYASLFNYTEHLLQMIFHWNRWSLFFLAPLSFVLAWWVVQRFAPNARGSGIPQVMASIELASSKRDDLVNKLLSLRILTTKVVSSLLMVLGGGAIGREGPTIQIAASIFRIVNDAIPGTWPRLSRQSYILTGAAAGLAAAFNTPLGGMVFAMEELARIHIRFFRTALFSAVIIAGLTAQGLLGPYLYLGYPHVDNLRFSIFFFVTATAIVAGFGGSMMSKLILLIMKWRRRLTKTSSNLLFLIATGLVIATVTFFINEDILGSGKDVMERRLFSNDKNTSWHTVLGRILGPALSFSTGAAGGIFAPSLAAGATTGAFIADLFNIVGSNANILILAGMVGFLTGITRTPFTSAILVLEMTDRHSVIFHLMLAAMVAQLASVLVDKHSLYDHLKKQYIDDTETSGLEKSSS